MDKAEDQSNISEPKVDTELIYVEFVDDGHDHIKCHLYPFDQKDHKQNHWPPINEGPGGRICISDYHVLAGIRFVTTRQALLANGFNLNQLVEQ